MCTYQTATVTIEGSGKAQSWFPLTEAQVYYDHPVLAPAEHTLNIDFRNPSRGPSSRVAVELDAGSARELAEAILTMLELTGQAGTGEGSGIGTGIGSGSGPG